MNDGTSSETHLSVSQIDMLLRCGKQYELEKIDGVQRQPAYNLMGGTAYHAAVEAWDYARFYGGAPDKKGAIDIFYDEFNKAVDEAKREWDGPIKVTGRKSKDWPEKENYDYWVQMGPVFVNWYCEWSLAQPWKIWELPGSEEPALEVVYDVTLIDKDGYETPVRGAIDQIREYPNGNLVVVDHKSGASTPKASRQLGIYKVATEVLFGQTIDFGLYCLPRTSPPGDTVPNPLTRWTYDRVASDAAKADKMKKQKLFIANPGDACIRMCNVRKHCEDGI